MKPIPGFPQTRPIELEDKPFFDGLLRRYPPVVSEWTFTNLFAWRRAYQFGISLLGGFLVLIAQKDRQWRIFEPVGPDRDKPGIIREVFRAAPAQARVSLVRVSERTAAFFKKSPAFKIREDSGNFDYLYLTKDLIELKGGRFDAKRNFIKRFKENRDYRYEPLTPAGVEDCLVFKEQWCLRKDCRGVQGLKQEEEAFAEILKNFNTLKVRGGMIKIGGRVEAVSLGEALNPDTFVVHMEKANDRWTGIYPAINQFFCRGVAAGFSYVNREQDLGLPGLRRAKQSYHPCMMIKKYTVERKDKII